MAHGSQLLIFQSFVSRFPWQLNFGNSRCIHTPRKPANADFFFHLENRFTSTPLAHPLNDFK